MAILIDTNVLVAYFNPRDGKHSSARQLMRDVVREPRLVVAPVLNEFFYLLSERAYYKVAVDSLSAVTQMFPIIPIETQDYERVVEIMDQYRDVEFDYTDAAIMVVSERMGISRIATFDRRDFEIFRPTHVPAYELLPTL